MNQPFHTGEGQDVRAGGRVDPLTELERRWELLAKTVQALREENAALWGQLQGREDHVSRVEQELTEKKAEIAALQETQQRTNERIDGLLARFDVTEP